MVENWVTVSDKISSTDVSNSFVSVTSGTKPLLTVKAFTDSGELCSIMMDGEIIPETADERNNVLSNFKEG